MSIRLPLFFLPLALAFLGCAHDSSQSVASPSRSSGTKASATGAGVSDPGKLVDEGPASASAGAAASASGGQLVPFRSSGGFTVLMPANPQQVDRTEETPSGPVQVHIAQAADPAAQYVSVYSEFPPGALEKVKTPELLDAFQRSTLQQMNGTLVASRDLQLDGLPGREFTATTAQGQEMTARLLVAPGRVYSLSGTYPQGGQTPEPVQRFLGSFSRAAGGPGVGGSGPASESPAGSATTPASDGIPTTPRPGNPTPRSPRGTEVPTGPADPSGKTPNR